MSKYLIEFRFFGNAKYQIKELVKDIKYKFRYKSKYRTIPHITLVGPFHTRDEMRLINDFNEICVNSPLLFFEIDGYDTFDENRVVYININPSIELKIFRQILSKTLQSYCSLTSYDYNENFAFHSTIANKVSPHKYISMKNYIDSIPKLKFKHSMIRVTLIKNGLILKEYDFILREMLDRKSAKDPYLLRKTLNKVSKMFSENVDNKESKHYVISDLHLGHTNIIKYCKRPFRSIKRMNEILVNNWNKVIKEKDIVYFLGDLSHSKYKNSTDYWLEKLNGNIIFIRGNHDNSMKINLKDYEIIEYKNYNFYLCHEPKNVPKDWKDWAICGHHHNNRLDEFPFFNRKTKRINVSVELTRYKPVSLDYIIKIIESDLDFIEKIEKF